MTQPVEVPNASQVAKLLGGSYIERRDVKARQFDKGYAPVRVDPRDTSSASVPWSSTDLLDHLRGGVSYGHYLVSLEGTCRMFAFDIDLAKKVHVSDPELQIDINMAPREVWNGPTSPEKVDLAKQLKSMAYGLAIRTKSLLGVKVTCSYSGNKGMHVIAVLDPGTPASEARDAAKTVLDSLDVFELYKGSNFYRHKMGYNALEIEVFPKQDEVREGDGMGNLMRLPLGVNKKSGKPSFFMDMTTPMNIFRADDPLKVLEFGSIR